MTYLVVTNDDGQHSVWLAAKELPAGWRPTGYRGSRDDCLAHIATVWTDIRPRSAFAAGQEDQ